MKQKRLGTKAVGNRLGRDITVIEQRGKGLRGTSLARGHVRASREQMSECDGTD